MHPLVGAVVATVILLPAIWHARQRTCEPAAPAAVAPVSSNPSTLATPAAGRVVNPGLFAAQPGDLALDVSGVARLQGALDVVGDLRLNGRSLGSILQALLDQGRAACGSIPCVHGVHEFLRTCRCVCEDGWSGQACDTHACNGNGLWNAALLRCECTPPFESSTQCRYQLCRGVMATTCPALLETGCDTPGAFADNCSDVCAAPQSCSRRANWGRALVPALGYRVGICGAGFVLTGGLDEDEQQVRMGAMVCASTSNISQCAAQFLAEAPYCCAPGAECGAPACADTSCCAQRLHRESCLRVGCVWASGRVCMFPAVADTSTDCELPLLTNTAGTWSYHSSMTRGRQTARVRYAQLYEATCGTIAPINASTPVNSSCLALAFDLVNAEPWPEMAESSVGYLAIFELATTDGFLGECSGVLCKTESASHALRFQFIPAASSSPTAWQTSRASGFLLTRAGGRLVCIGSSRMPALLSMQLYRAGIPLVSVDSEYCGIYVLPDGGQLRDEDGTRALAFDSTRIAVWSLGVPADLQLNLVV